MAAILQLRRGTNASTGSITFTESELFYNQSKETLQISNAGNNLITLARLDRINTGSLHLTGDFTASNALFTGDITFGGSLITLGNENTDNIVIGGELSSSIIPNNDNSFDLGSDTRRYRNLYSVSGSIDNINGINFTNFVNSTNAFTSSQNTKNSTLATYTGSVNSQLTELYSTASTHEGRIDDLTSVTGSYATTGSNEFKGTQEITGSVFISGSRFEAKVAWPSIGSQYHLFEPAAFSLTGLDSGSRTYGYNAIGLEHYEEGPSYHNSILHHFWSSSDFNDPNNFGSETNFGPLHSFFRIWPSGSDQTINQNLGNISLTDLQNGKTRANIYANEIHIGAYLNDTILIGNTGSYINVKADSIFVESDITASSFKGDGEQLTNITASYVDYTNIDLKPTLVSGSSQINVNDTQNFQTFSSSVDARIDTLEISFSSSVDSRLDNLEITSGSHETRLDSLESYTSSLKTAIGVNGSNVTINGDLSVLGTTTQINSTQVNIGENILELNYGGAVSKGGIFVSDATGTLTSGSLLWNAVTDRWIAGPSGSESKILLADGDGVVSGSSQVTSSLDFRYLTIDGDNVVSGSSQIDITQTSGYSTFSSSLATRINSLEIDSASQDSRLDNLEITSGSHKNRLDNLESFTSSQETKNNTLQTYTSSLNSSISQIETFTSSIDTTIKNKLNVEGVVSSSSDSSTIDFTITQGVITGNVIGGIISGSSQLTQSLDSRYEISGSVAQLIGIRTTSGSLGSAAWYNVSNSIDDGNPAVLGNAGAIKSYIDARVIALGLGDIESVNAGNGLSGGGTSGNVTLSLDTNSVTFTNGVKSKLDADGVISGSSQIVTILTSLNSFSSSQETKNSTLASYTGSVNTQLTELYSTASNHETRIDSLENWSSSLDTLFVTETDLTNLSSSIDARLDNSETFSASIDTTIKTKLNVEGVISGSSQLLGGSGLLSSSNETFNTFSASVDSRIDNIESFSSSIDTTIKTKLNVEGVISGSSQIVNILGPLNAFSASQETKNTTLGTYTASVDNSLIGLNAVSHSHSNKANLDTINQNLASTSDVTFGSLHTSGTGSIGTNLTVYGNLTVFGTQSIINSENLSVNDNLIYLAPTASGDWDLGIVGHYNDGTYSHAGIFSDASDSHTWKVFKGLTPETTGSVDTSHPSFTLADFKAANFTGTSFNGIINATNGVISGSLQAQLPAGVVSGSSQVNADSITNFDANVLAYNNSLGVISGSSQVNADSITNFDSNVLAYNNSLGVISGSSQITLSSTNGFGTYINQGVLTSSDVQFNSLGIGMAASATAGRIDATNDIVAYSSSDRRFKDNIKPIENALDKINQIGGYEFDWKEENKIEHGYEGHDLGVIAQEIETIAPELVQTRENGYKAVKYDKLVSVLIQAVKELSAKVTELENK